MARSDNIHKSTTVYDYIVIGCGAAGAIVASRLSGAGFKVLLLERGDSVSWFNPITTDPRTWGVVSKFPSVEWAYKSTPQKHLKDRIINLSSAKALGGCQVSKITVIMDCAF